MKQYNNTYVSQAELGNLVCWNEGRRVVELGVLAENLGTCRGEGCYLMQDLRNTISERRSDLGSLLWIQCSCGHVNPIETGKSHKTHDKGGAIYDVNTKVAAAMIHAGMSQVQVENFTSGLEIPLLLHAQH